MLLKVGDALLRSGTTLIALKGEWLCNDTDCQRSDLARNLCHYRASACSCTTAHTSRDEYHVRAFEGLIQLFSILFGCLGPNTGIATRTEATGKLIPDTDMVCSLREQQGLGIGIDGNELYSHHIYLYHAVNRITAPTSDTDDTDLGEAFYLMISHW